MSVQLQKSNIVAIKKTTVSLRVISEMRSFCNTREGGVIWETYLKSSGTGI